MIGMILGGVVGYLLAGMITSRVLFIATLGDNPRHRGLPTAAYRDAQDAALWGFLLWPLALVALPLIWLAWQVADLVTRPTPYEKKLKRQKAREAAQAQATRLAKEYDLPMPGQAPLSVPVDPPKPMRTRAP